MKVRYANKSDFNWLVNIERHVHSAWVSRCIANKEYLICEREGDRIGFLRYSYFWGSIPYMDMIFILEHHRRGGAGTALFDFWKTKMEENGAKILMTSSATEEKEPQEWHYRNGFKESGQLTFGQHDPSPEIFFVKNL